jgi:dipeptidyl aminopeptidase/acylaminoacyl peptidase
MYPLLRWSHMNAAKAALTFLASVLLAAQAADAQRAPSRGARAVRDSVPTATYRVYVAAEAVDEIAVFEFGPNGVHMVRKQPVGIMLADPDGPHGVALSPDQRDLYVTTAHGLPYGWLWRYDATTGAYRDKVLLGNFPATAQVSPDGEYVWVVNFNLHGEMVPSDVSVVRTRDLLEIARIPTCTMPHGSRLNGDGTKHYSACMMDDMMVEIDARTFDVSRHFMLTKGDEHGMNGAPRVASGHEGHGAAHDMGGHGLTAPAAGSTRCSPTWAQPTRDGAHVWVACNGTSELVEIRTSDWTMTRRLPAGNGVYNLAITSDGARLVATNKRDQSVSVIDTRTGRELKRLPTQRRVVHGAAISDDDRYAFVSVEGIGSEPGTVEIIDLRSLTTVARVDVGQMAGGVDVLTVRPSPTPARSGAGVP